MTGEGEMGFLESLVAGVTEASSGKLKLNPAQIAQFVQAAAGIISKIGLPKLIDMFEKADLGDKIKSWISTGTNKAVSGLEITKALGSKIVGELAKKTGLDSSMAADALAH